MKKLGIGLTAALAMVLGMAVTASAQPNGLYFAPKIGYSHMKGKFTDEVDGTSESGSKGQFALGLAAGYDFKSAFDVPLRTEFEYVWRGKKEVKSFEDGGDTIKLKVGAQTFFVNAFFDIHNSSPVTPYIGAGLGLAILSAEIAIDGDESSSKNKTNFAWNIGAGAAWKVAENVALDLGYRYADFGKAVVDIGDGVKAKSNAHEVLLGLRYTF